MPDLNATITGIVASFFTHNDNKDNDTSVSVFVQNRVNLFLSQDTRVSGLCGGVQVAEQDVWE
jgi:hypothetical protein